MRQSAFDGPMLVGINSSNAYHHPYSSRHTSAMLFSRNKRWEALLAGNVVIVSQGDIDSDKTKTVKKTFDDSYDAKVFFLRILKKKLESRERWVSAFNARDGEISEDRRLHGPSEIMYGRYPNEYNLQERRTAIAMPDILSALDELEGIAIPALMEDDLRSGAKHIQIALTKISKHNQEDLSLSLVDGILSAKRNLAGGLDSDQVIRDLSDLVDQIRSKI